jgi:hypothetical protein
MKSLTFGLIFCHSRCSEPAPTGFSNRVAHDLGVSLTSIASIARYRNQTTPPHRREDIIREFGSTGFDQLVEGIIQQVDVYQDGD